MPDSSEPVAPARAPSCTPARWGMRCATKFAADLEQTMKFQCDRLAALGLGHQCPELVEVV